MTTTTEETAPVDTPPQTAPAAGGGAPPKTPRKPSGAQRRKAGDSAPSSAPKGKRLSADALAIEKAANDLLAVAVMFLPNQGDQLVLTALGPTWCTHFAAVVDKHPQLKKLLASGAGMSPELQLAFCTAQIAWAIRANHPPKPKVAPAVDPTQGAGSDRSTEPAPVSDPAPAQPSAAGLVGVDGDVSPELVELLTGFHVPDGPTTEADQAAFLAHAARVHT